MKKFKFISVFALSLMLLSCGGSSEGNATNSSIDMDGRTYEVNVLDFDTDNKKTTVEIINRSEETISSIRGRLVFRDAENNQLTTATGRGIDSPFQQTENPNLVGKKAAKKITLWNDIPENTKAITLSEVYMTLNNGEEVMVD